MSPKGSGLRLLPPPCTAAFSREVDERVERAFCAINDVTEHFGIAEYCQCIEIRSRSTPSTCLATIVCLYFSGVSMGSGPRGLNL